MQIIRKGDLVKFEMPGGIITKDIISDIHNHYVEGTKYDLTRINFKVIAIEDKLVDQVKELIKKDFNPNELMDIKSFEDLQNETDANMYFINAGFDYNGTDIENSFLNKVIDKLNNWLKNK